MNRFYTYLIFVLLLSFGASAQKDAALREKNIKKADDLYQRADFLKAYNLYVEILKYDTTHPEFNFRAGHCLFSINKTDTACVKFFLHSKDSIAESHYFLGKVYLFNGQ